MRLPAALIASSVFACIACDTTLPARGQLLIHLDTDAPIRATNVPGRTLAPVPLFDRVLVEIFEPERSTPCADCVREFPLDADAMRDRRFSFGFVPTPRTLGYRVRLRMYRSRGGLGPFRASTIELVGYLPAIREEGVVALTATFRTGDVGRPRGTLDAPIVFDPGAPSVSAEGTWEGAAVVDCEGAAPNGATCIPGGAYFMGDPRISVDEGSGGAAEHLVTLSPFFLDDREVTIGTFRASGLAAIDSRGESFDPTDDSNDQPSSCAYTTAAGDREDRPVNCISWSLASRFCESRGGRLPTEAELEAVASLRGAGFYPWGDSDPLPDEAVGPSTNLGTDDAGIFGAPTIPAPAGSGRLDRVVVPNGTILDLGGNLAEWAADSFASDDEPCWSSNRLVDPRCVIDGRLEKSVKGGSVDDRRLNPAQVRVSSSASPGIGFRCAYPGRAK